jgi:hypothetical protein
LSRHLTMISKLLEVMSSIKWLRELTNVTQHPLRADYFLRVAGAFYMYIRSFI